MALIKCPECGKDISEFSENCIGCGYPISKYMMEHKLEKEMELIDITKECNEIRKMISDFKSNYVPLQGTRIDIEAMRGIKNSVYEKIGSLSLEAQKQIKSDFAESICTVLCENNNTDVLNFTDVKEICDIVSIEELTESGISNIAHKLYAFVESKTGSSDIMPLSWLIYVVLNSASEADVALLEATLRKPNAFGNPRKQDVIDVVDKIKNESTKYHTTGATEKYIPKCPTCQSTDIKKVSTASKAGSVFMWGLLSQKVKKQWHCNNCGSEW